MKDFTKIKEEIFKIVDEFKNLKMITTADLMDKVSKKPYVYDVLGTLEQKQKLDELYLKLINEIDHRIRIDAAGEDVNKKEEIYKTSLISIQSLFNSYKIITGKMIE